MMLWFATCLYVVTYFDDMLLGGHGKKKVDLDKPQVIGKGNHYRML